MSALAALLVTVPGLAQPTDPPPDPKPAETPASPPPADPGTPPPGEEAKPAEKQQGTLEVRIEDEEGTIFVDGERKGWGIFKGPLEVGEHTIKVTRPGYETFEKTITIKHNEVISETVALTQAAAGDEDALFDEGDWTFDGLYGGVQLHGMFLPSGSGNTLDDSCDTLGATACEGGLPAGGGIGGYIGYAFAPLGFEVLLLAGGDVNSPAAEFDGSTGSDINPLVAAPARDEEFLIGRFGGGGALRLRLLIPFDRFRVTGALGFGLGYKFAILKRDTMSRVDEGTSETSDDGQGYVTPVLSMELAGQIRIAGRTSLALGFNLWLEHAGSDLQTEPIRNAVITGGAIPRPLNTPAYDMATGTQVFIGPFVGFQFGP